MKPSPKSPFESDSARAAASAKKYALSVATLSRAAEEGYDVSDSVCESLTERILTALDENDELGDRVLVTLTEKTSAFAACEVMERKSPYPESLALRDDVVACVSKISKPVGFNVDVGRISRYKERVDCEHEHGVCPECQPSTVVVVTIGAPVLGVRERAIVVSVE